MDWEAEAYVNVVAVALQARYPGTVPGKYFRIFLAIAFAVAPFAMVQAMPTHEALISVMGDCPDMPSRQMPSKDCALSCMAALPAIVEIIDSPAMPALPADSLRLQIGQPFEPDVATPPPRSR